MVAVDVAQWWNARLEDTRPQPRLNLQNPDGGGSCLLVYHLGSEGRGIKSSVLSLVHTSPRPEWLNETVSKQNKTNKTTKKTPKLNNMAIMAHNEQKPLPKTMGRSSYGRPPRRKLMWDPAVRKASIGSIWGCLGCLQGSVVIDTSTPSASTSFQGASCIDHWHYAWWVLMCFPLECSLAKYFKTVNACLYSVGIVRCSISLVFSCLGFFTLIL